VYLSESPIKSLERRLVSHVSLLSYFFLFTIMRMMIMLDDDDDDERRLVG